MPDREQRADTLVLFIDDAGTEYACKTRRNGHPDAIVRAVAYRWAISQVTADRWRPDGELRFHKIERIT